MNLSLDLHWPKIRRAWIERTAHRRRTIRRTEICEALEISMQQAAADLKEVMRLHPGCLTRDHSAKLYRWTGGDILKTEVPAFLHAVTAKPRSTPRKP